MNEDFTEASTRVQTKCDAVSGIGVSFATGNVLMKKKTNLNSQNYKKLVQNTCER